MSSKRYPPAAPSGPSYKSRRQDSPDIEPMVVDPPEAVIPSRVYPPHVLSDIAAKLRDALNGRKLGDETSGTDPTFRRILQDIYFAVLLSTVTYGEICPNSFLKNFEQVRENAAKRSAAGFIDLLRTAMDGRDESELWGPVVAHGMSANLRFINGSFLKPKDIFHTVIPNDPSDSEPSKGKRVSSPYHAQGNISPPPFTQWPCNDTFHNFQLFYDPGTHRLSDNVHWKLSKSMLLL